MSVWIISIGLSLIAIDVVLLGFSTLFLTAFGLGALVVGVTTLPGVGFLDELSVPEAIFYIAILGSLFTAILWPTLKRLQNNGGDTTIHTENDIVGSTITLSSDYQVGQPFTHRYSGIDWKIESAENHPAGAQVKVLECHVGRLVVGSKMPEKSGK